MPIRSESQTRYVRSQVNHWMLYFILSGTLIGCGNEPSQREIQNARAFEALLTAVSLKNQKEFERDAKLLQERHDSGEISDEKYREIEEILNKGKAKDWAGAEKKAYEFRSQFGDRGSFFY